MKKLLLLLLFFPLLMQAQGTGENLPSNYPKVESTGDAQKDHDNWINAKKDWIANNPDAYKAMGGNPSIANSLQNEKHGSKEYHGPQNPMRNQTVHLIGKCCFGTICTLGS